MIRLRIFSVILCVSFCLVASLSGYSLGERGSASWDIALMLTPVGIVKNLLLIPDHELRPYYFQPTVREGFFSDGSMVLIFAYLGVAVAAFALLALLRRRWARP